MGSVNITYDEGTVYLAGAGSFPAPSDIVYAYDATTCTPRWNVWVAPRIDKLVAGSGVVYVNADDGYRMQGSNLTLTALRATDGKTLWHRGPVGRVSLGSGWQFATQPIVLGPTLYAVSAVPLGGLQFLVASDVRMHLYALNGTDGSEYWTVPIGHAITY